MMVVGAQYYRPPNPPRAAWSRDLQLMRRHGFNTVKLWCCWSWMGPQPGRCDFDDIDELMDLAQAHELRVVLNIILEDAPYWLEGAQPQARYVDSEGRAVALGGAMNTPGGGWPGLCFDNQEVWEAARDFVRALTERYRSHPALAVWDVWNEPHLEPASYFPDRWYCYCPASQERFRSWLVERYGDLGRLNDHWSRRFSTWDEVQPPRLFESVPDVMDWREFWFQNLRRWLELRVHEVSAADPGHPVMTHVALSGYTGQLATHTIDEHVFGDVADIFGTSSFPQWLMGNDPVEHLLNLEAARSAARTRPYWQAELQGGKGRREGTRSTPHPTPDDVALWMWDAAASGASGVMFWQWRPELLGPESPGYGLCQPDGSVSPRLVSAAQVARDLVSAPLAGMVLDRARVAVLVSRRTALHAFVTDRSMDIYAQAVRGAFRLLADADVHVTLFHEDALAAGEAPAVLWWPMPSVCSDALAGQLDDYVGQGGTLVAEASPGEYDENGRHRARWPDGALGELFGSRVLDNDVAMKVTISLSGACLSGSWQSDHLEVGTAEAIGYFADGTVGATSRAHGKGRAILVGTHPALHYEAHRDDATRQAVLQLLGPAVGERLGPPAWRRPQPGLFTRQGTSASGRLLVIFLNWTTDVHEVDCPAPCTVLGLNPPGGRAEEEGTFVVPPHSSLQLVVENSSMTTRQSTRLTTATREAYA